MLVLPLTTLCPSAVGRHFPHWNCSLRQSLWGEGVLGIIGSNVGIKGEI